MKIGYARVSSGSQSLELQTEALIADGCKKIYREKESGRSTVKRDELERALEDLRPGDELTVTRLDRLARSVQDLYSILQRVAEAGATFRSINQAEANTGTPTGKLLLGILGLVAEFENDLRRERQLEGIEKARAAGKYRGKQATLDPVKVKAAVTEAGSYGKAAKLLGCSKASVGRIMGELARWQRSTGGRVTWRPSRASGRSNSSSA
jgi:DNA invertase Pin-like site-specific DNA recombinase